MADNTLNELEKILKRLLDESRLDNSSETYEEHKKTQKLLEDELEKKRREIVEANKKGYELEGKELEEHTKKTEGLIDAYGRLNKEFEENKQKTVESANKALPELRNNIYKTLGADNALFKKSNQFGKIGEV